MEAKKQHIIYSQADIENYLQGKMSKEAMHSLERAALQDEFLADAIEGYRFADASISTKKLAAIEAMILANKQDAKVVPITIKKNEWFKVAVAIILFAGVGYIGFLLMNNGNKKAIVSNENDAKIENPNIVIADSNNQIVSTLKEQKLEQKELASPKADIARNEEIVSANNSKQGTIISQEFKDATTSNVAPTQTNQGSAANATVSNQNIASNKSAGPSVNNNATNYTTSNDYKAESLAMEVEKNSKAKVAKEVVGTYSNMAGNKPAENSVVVLPTIRMQRDSSFESIPVTAFASKKNAAKPIAYKLSKEDSSTVPVNGWAAFNDYLQHNNQTTISYDTAYSPVTITNSKTGEEIVGLEFDIDKNGTPNKIKITKSVDEETDAKAIELLKKGPKWTSKDTKQKGKVSIKF